MRLRYAMEKGFNGFRACTSERALAFLTFPLAPFLSHTGRGRGNMGCESDRILAIPHVMVAQVR